jgi:hypothetical protein
MKLKEALPEEFTSGEYDDSSAIKLADAEIESKHDSRERRWPGPHKNVHFWVALKNGKAVGWNENPGRGWSFPVIAYRSIDKTPSQPRDAATQHAHWSRFNENHGLKVFDEIYALIASGGDVSAKAKELADLACSYGYGEADSHASAKENADTDSPEWQDKNKSYQEYENSDYWECLVESERLLTDAAHDDQSREAAIAACEGAKAAYLRGRQAREAMDVTLSPSP